MNPDPAALRCDPETAAAIRAMVNTWPPLTEAQKATLSVLLAPPPQDEGGAKRNDRQVKRPSIRSVEEHGLDRAPAPRQP